MRVAFALVFGTLLVGCHADELSVETDEQGIVNGSEYDGDPAVVLLDLGGGLCTGTLISPRVVLTAAHCLTGDATAIRALFVSDMRESGVTIRAKSYEIKSGTDLGAITLNADGPVDPIPANPHSLSDQIGEPVKIVGFGVTTETGSDSGIKRMGMATLDALGENGAGAGELTTTNDPQGTCYGDSGGPNFMTIDGVQFVAGVTSRGTDECGAGLDVAVQVDEHIGWIRNYIAANDPGDCGADNRCSTDCVTVDIDCCVSDGRCIEECGSSDPECGATEDGPRELSNAVGSCSAAGGSGAGGWLVLLGVVSIGFRRRRRQQPERA